MFKKILSLFFFCLLLKWGTAQNPDAIQLYIENYKDLAIEEMIRTGVPAAIKLAQGIHETDAGNSILVKKSNNHFGIKCKSEWKGPSVKHTDDKRNECFRKYNSATESYTDHSDFLKNSQRYAFLFELDPTDYEGWAKGLKKAGYATNPKYSQILIKLIEDYQLQDYTLIAMGQMNPRDVTLAKNTILENQTKVDPVFADIKTNVPEKKEASQPVKITEQKLIYPQGEFKINETRVVFVKQGTSYLSIALQYDVPLARIFEFNELLLAEETEKDQLIYLQRKRKTGNNEFHIVKPGESLNDIAQEEAIRFETLLEYNLLTKEMKPAIGEKLYLKTKAPMKPKLVLKENYSISNFRENVRN